MSCSLVKINRLGFDICFQVMHWNSSNLVIYTRIKYPLIQCLNFDLTSSLSLFIFSFHSKLGLFINYSMVQMKQINGPLGFHWYISPSDNLKFSTGWNPILHSCTHMPPQLFQSTPPYHISQTKNSQKTVVSYLSFNHTSIL